MKFGFRIPSLKKRIAARTSVKRVIRHSLGFKAPRGWGFLTNPKKAISAAVKKSPPNNVIKIAAFLAILGLIVYFLTQDNGTTEPTPQQIYE